MYITEKEYKIALDVYSFIDETVKKFAEEYATEFCGGKEWVSKVDFDPDAGLIEIEEEYSYCGCCSNDYETYYLPIEYLWDKDWVGREKEKRAEKIRLREIKAAEKKVAKEAERKEARYQKYLSMKEEYED